MVNGDGTGHGRKGTATVRTRPFAIIIVIAVVLPCIIFNLPVIAGLFPYDYGMLLAARAVLSVLVSTILLAVTLRDRRKVFISAAVTVLCTIAVMAFTLSTGDAPMRRSMEAYRRLGPVAKCMETEGLLSAHHPSTGSTDGRDGCDTATRPNTRP